MQFQLKEHLHGKDTRKVGCSRPNVPIQKYPQKVMKKVKSNLSVFHSTSFISDFNHNMMEAQDALFPIMLQINSNKLNALQVTAIVKIVHLPF